MQMFELAIKKWKVYGGFIFFLLVVMIVMPYGIFNRLYVLGNKKMFFRLFLWLLLYAYIFWFLVCRLFSYWPLLKKGYVARLTSQGLLLADDRFVPWHEISAVIKQPSEGRSRFNRIIVQLKTVLPKTIFQKIFSTSNDIELQLFKMSLDEAYNIVTSYWERYR